MRRGEETREGLFLSWIICNFLPYFTHTHQLLPHLTHTHTHQLDAAQTILVAYQTIDARTALATLNLASNADLGRFLTTEMQWTGVVIGDDGMLALPATKDNSMKPAVIQESVTFEQLAKVLVQGR